MLGSDSRGANSTARADSIVLMRTDPGKHLISMLSIPRDLYVNIPGHGRTKINAAYAYGGAPLLIRTINTLTGLQVNHIVLVDFAGFKELIDSLGGVTLYNKRKIVSSQPFDGHNWRFRRAPSRSTAARRWPTPASATPPIRRTPTSPAPSASSW